MRYAASIINLIFVLALFTAQVLEGSFHDFPMLVVALPYAITIAALFYFKNRILLKTSYYLNCACLMLVLVFSCVAGPAGFWSEYNGLKLIAVVLVLYFPFIFNVHVLRNLIEEQVGVGQNG